MGHDVPVFDFDGAGHGRFDTGLFGASLGRPADVEGSHGQLRARLANRLRGDHANGLADIDTRTAS